MSGPKLAACGAVGHRWIAPPPGAHGLRCARCGTTKRERPTPHRVKGEAIEPVYRRKRGR